MNSLLESTLHDEKTFYQIFFNDLLGCEKEVYIESPFITNVRMKQFHSIFYKLLAKGVKIYIVTKDPADLANENLRYQAEVEIHNFERIGVQTLLCINNHHRKLAILDRKILWEGSLNILSQAYSREVMRRIPSEEVTLQMFEFLKLDKFL